MFVDLAEIYVRGGKGGSGCVSFRREKFVPRGGPDGGDGGDGGSVYLVASRGVDTLLDFAGRHHWIAENGRPGEGKSKRGRSGHDLRVDVPPGTLIYDRTTELLIKDLAGAGDDVCVARGGAGGRGNQSFATPTHQTPTEAEPGEPSEERWLRLELKLIADVGIVGLPNAGKSTLLSRLSRARPRIAAYPFTTLHPQLGIVELSGYRRFTLADIPGLIEGAHHGAGLGDSFLRHIERTRLIVHLIDVCPLDDRTSPLEAYRVVRNELAQYSPSLAAKPEILVANKLDLNADTEQVSLLQRELDRPVWKISAATGLGLAELTDELWRQVCAHRQAETPEVTNSCQSVAQS